MSLEQIMGELKGCSIPYKLDQGMLYATINEGSRRSPIAAAALYLVQREDGHRLYFTATPESYERYAARVGRSVLGQEILSQVNKVIPPTLTVSVLGAYIDCQEMTGIANVFKAFYGQPFTPIQGLSQKEEITEKILEDDPDPDTITAQSL
jgi:hypothetical protein